MDKAVYSSDQGETTFPYQLQRFCLSHLGLSLGMGWSKE